MRNRPRRNYPALTVHCALLEWRLTQRGRELDAARREARRLRAINDGAGPIIAGLQAALAAAEGEIARLTAERQAAAPAAAAAAAGPDGWKKLTPRPAGQRIALYQLAEEAEAATPTALPGAHLRSAS